MCNHVDMYTIMHLLDPATHLKINNLPAQHYFTVTRKTALTLNVIIWDKKANQFVENPQKVK